MQSLPERPKPKVESIDPSLIPFRILNSGARMPAIGLGTFGSDHVSHEAVAEAVRYAASIGYRHFDCASVYGNEDQIGQVFRELFHNGLRREEVWITSKLWNDKHGENDVIASCQKSLADLQLDYLDLYLVHWPFPNHHPPGCDVSARNPHAVPYIHENFMRTWRMMEELVDRGLVRHIGTSNMTIPKMELLLARRAHQAGGQRNGASSALSAAGILPLSVEERDSACWILSDRFACPPGARPDAGRHIAHRRSRDLQNRARGLGSSGRGVHQMGRPARANPDSVLSKSP